MAASADGAVSGLHEADCTWTNNVRGPFTVRGHAQGAMEEISWETLMIEYLYRHWDWSKRTFGQGKRTAGVIQHIRKELTEIEAKPDDLEEWIDVVILAMDGYWRHGGTPESFMRDLQAKQDKNFTRKWPTPKSEDEAVEHIK